MFTLRQYLTSLEDTYGLTRTLGVIDICRDKQGRMCYHAGNSAAVFRIRHQGHIRALRCYTHPPRHAAEIYGDRLLPQELFLYTSPTEGIWVDVVLNDWIEGITLREAVAAATTKGDTPRLQALAGAFDRLSATLTADDRAHGDLKPENILLDPQGGLHLIDLDASFLPAFAGETSPELGTAAYQHPTRTARDFDASIDDYPAALLSTALHALALDASLHARYADADGLLFSPQRIAADPALGEALALFEARGMAVQYRIGRLLYAPTLRLPGLAELLRLAAERTTDQAIDKAPERAEDSLPELKLPASAENSPPELKPPASAEDSPPELFVENGLWGYRTADRAVIPPLYDCGFDFTEGLAAVLLGATWHFIDPAGSVRLSCPGCEAVKPFRGGRARIIRNGCPAEIDREGREFAI